MNRLNSKRQTANPFLLYLYATWKVAVSMSLLTATSAWSQPVPGSLDAHWNEGASDCKATPQAPLQVHAYEPQTFILRQNPCADFEANFLYLLVGSDKALLIDTGAVADPKEMPLAKTILELLPEKDHKKLPLLVAHTHRHMDHRAGDPQFASLPSVQIVPIDLEGVRTFYGFTDWPNGIAHLDLGGRTVDVIPDLLGGVRWWVGVGRAGARAGEGQGGRRGLAGGGVGMASHGEPSGRKVGTFWRWARWGREMTWGALPGGRLDVSSAGTLHVNLILVGWVSTLRRRWLQPRPASPDTPAIRT